MSYTTRLNRLARQVDGRRGRQAHTRLDEMTDAQLLRNLARLETVYRQVIDGLEADNRLCGRVDALLKAGDLAGAWALLDRPSRIVN